MRTLAAAHYSLLCNPIDLRDPGHSTIISSILPLDAIELARDGVSLQCQNRILSCKQYYDQQLDLFQRRLDEQVNSVYHVRDAKIKYITTPLVRSILLDQMSVETRTLLALPLSSRLARHQRHC